jgi:hypothetical protein
MYKGASCNGVEQSNLPQDGARQAALCDRGGRYGGRSHMEWNKGERQSSSVHQRRTEKAGVKMEPQSPGENRKKRRSGRDDVFLPTPQVGSNHKPPKKPKGLAMGLRD